MTWAVVISSAKFTLVTHDEQWTSSKDHAHECVTFIHFHSDHICTFIINSASRNSRPESLQQFDEKDRANISLL